MVRQAGVNWQEWTAGNEVTSTESLQRGAANFVNYCLACHSLKYMRYQRWRMTSTFRQSSCVAA